MANIITGIRIGLSAALLFFPASSPAFFALYMAGGVSDMIDGAVARRTGTESEFGSRLDTFADKVYHIHLRYAGDDDEQYFRDHLNEHPDAAKEYEALKLRLWKRYEHDRDTYTMAKTGFILNWTAEARKEYGDRY